MPGANPEAAQLLVVGVESIDDDNARRRADDSASSSSRPAAADLQRGRKPPPPFNLELLSAEDVHLHPPSELPPDYRRSLRLLSDVEADEYL